MWYCSVGVVAEISNMYTSYIHVVYICATYVTYVAYLFKISAKYNLYTTISHVK